MKRLHALFARRLVRIVSLTLLVGVALTLIVFGNRDRWTAHSGARPIAASQAATIVKNGQAEAIDVQVDRAYLTTNTDGAEYVFVKDREATVPQMLQALGVSSAELSAVTYAVEEVAPISWGEVI